MPKAEVISKVLWVGALLAVCINLAMAWTRPALRPLVGGEFLGKILWHTALALLLLNVCLHFVRMVRESYQRAEMPRVIKPFHVSGSPLEATQHGTTLAYLLSGRLTEIAKEMRASEQALQDAEAASKAPEILLPVERENLVRPISLPNEVFQPLNLEMSVAHVEVGKLIAFVHNWLAQEQAVTMTVVYSGEKAVATGRLKQDAEDAVWVESTGKDDVELMTDLAYAIAQKPFAKKHAQVAHLEAKEFRELLTIMQRIAKLSRKAPHGAVNRADYLTIYREIEPWAKMKLPRWVPLVHLAADLAERAEQTEDALTLYKTELALKHETDASVSHKHLDGKIARLEQQITSATASAQSPASSAEKIRTADEVLRGLIAVPKEVPSDAIAPIIGIIGTTPPRGLLPAGVKVRTLAETGDKNVPAADDSHLQEYYANLVRAAHLVAPAAEFVFTHSATSIAGLSEASIAGAVRTLLESRQPVHVLLVPYAPVGGDTFKRLFQEVINQGIVVVLPAGNEPGDPPPFSKTPLSEHIAVGAAVDLRGRRARYTSYSSDVLWAPGEILSAGAVPSLQEGTSFSAAVTAGAAAVLKSIDPQIKPSELIALLRETAQADDKSAEKVIKVEAAVAKLREAQ